MLAVYCPRPSGSAFLLTQKLRELGVPVRRVRNAARLPRYTRVVGWGASMRELPCQATLNASLPVDKLHELVTLQRHGVACPAIVTADHPDALGRTYHHRGGADLLRPLARPDFYTAKLNLTHEYRVHAMHGEVLRTARKVAREGVTVHPWVRSSDSGWKMSYGPTPLPADALSVAHAAIAALGYDFGAVDVAKTNEGRFVVLEVNSAPGLDAGGLTLVKYAEAIRGWYHV